MAKKEMYKLVIDIDVNGDDKAKSNLKAMDKFIARTEKRARLLNKLKISPAVRVVDRASSTIDKISRKSRLLNKVIRTTATVVDRSSNVLDRIRNKSTLFSKPINTIINAKDKTSDAIGKVKAKVQNLASNAAISLKMKAEPALRAIALTRAKLGELTVFAAKAFGVVAIGAGIAVGAMLAGTMKMVDAASNLNESINVVSTTFAESGDQIVAWARTAGTGFGMGTQQVMEFTGQMGAMLKSSGIAGDELNTMTKGLVSLAGDMSSFYNLPHDEVWEKLRSGMMGETEPLKALGINMSVANMEAFSLSKGINKSWKEMSQAEQVALRYDYIMQQTSDAQGDFAKTAHTLPNQLRSLKNSFIDISTAIGQVFLPIVQNGLSDATKSFRNNFKDIIESLSSGDLVGAMDKIGKSFGEGLLRLGDIVHKMLPMINRSIISLFKSMVDSAYNYFPKFSKIFNDMLIQVGNRITREGPAIAKAFGQVLEMAFNSLQLLIPNLLSIGLKIGVSLCQGLINSGPQLISSLSQAISIMASSISANMPLLVSLALQIISVICTGLQQNMPLIIQAAYDLILGLANGISQNIPLLINTASQLINLICTAIIILLPQIIELGFQIINSLAAGLTSNSGSLMSALTNLGLTILSSIWNLLLTAAEAITTIISGVVEKLSFGVIKMPPLDLSSLKTGANEASQIGTNLSNSMVNGIGSGIPLVQSKSSELASAAQYGALNAVNSSNAQWSTLPQGVDAGFAQASMSVQQGATNMYNGARQSFSQLATVGRQAGSDLYNGVGTSLNMLSVNVRTACSNMYNGSKNSFESLKNSAISNISTMCSTVTSKVSALATTITSKWNSVKSIISTPITASFNVKTTQTTVKKTVDDSGKKSNTKHATGGIFTTPHYALFAEEAGGEAVIPLNGKRRDRAISLWQETGEKLGMVNKDRYRNAGNQSSYFTTGDRSRFEPKDIPGEPNPTGDNDTGGPTFPVYTPNSGNSNTPIIVNVDVNNNFDGDIDEESVIQAANTEFSRKLRSALKNIKK